MSNQLVAVHGGRSKWNPDQIAVFALTSGGLSLETTVSMVGGGYWHFLVQDGYAYVLANDQSRLDVYRVAGDNFDLVDTIFASPGEYLGDFAVHGTRLYLMTQDGFVPGVRTYDITGLWDASGLSPVGFVGGAFMNRPMAAGSDLLSMCCQWFNLSGNPDEPELVFNISAQSSFNLSDFRLKGPFLFGLSVDDGIRRYAVE